MSSSEQPVVKAGTLPSFLLDQEEIWIDTEGYRHDISDLDAPDCLWVIDYLLAHARVIRTQWAAELRMTYDPSEKARRWMLRRRCIVALMRQYVLQADPVIREIAEKAWQYDQLAE